MLHSRSSEIDDQDKRENPGMGPQTKKGVIPGSRHATSPVTPGEYVVSKEIVHAPDAEIAASLARFDEREMEERIRRLREVDEILAAEFEEGYWHTGGQEASWLLSEAKDSYVYGFPVASLLASHAACERRLAGIMSAYSDDQVPDGWEGWSLSRLMRWTAQKGHLPEEFVPRLRDLAARRNAIGHYRRPAAKDSVIYRFVAETDPQGADDAAGLVATLEADARNALRTAFELYYAVSGYP